MGFPSKQKQVRRMGKPSAESHVIDVAFVFQSLLSFPGDRLF